MPIAFALLFASGVAFADGAAAEPARPPGPASPPTDSLPGSAAPPGLGLSPQVPPVPPAPGNAPSFGAPNMEKPTSFQIGGRFFGWEAVGVGGRPNPAPAGYSGTALHSPLLSTGKVPFWGGAGATLNLQYATRYVTAYASYYFRLNRPEFNGYLNPSQGPSFGTAYLLFTPSPIGALRLTFRVGGFVESYGGPGQWGWGIFGPMLALRGFGETTNGEWDLTRDVRLTFAHGLLVVPGVPENFVRGDYNSYIETGVSDWVHHAHVGLVLNNQYTFRLHYASTRSADERRRLSTFLPNTPPADGRWDTYLGEARWQSDPWGQIGLSGGVYDFHRAASVGDGTWWAVDWTQGAREMINKYLGPASQGTGKVAVVGAEWAFSLSRILWAPRAFNGNAPDVAISIAAMLTRTVESGDPNYKGMNGYFVGTEAYYHLTWLFSLSFAAYGETRGSYLGQYSVYSLNPGIAFHTNWLSTDRIQLIYGRRFYSRAADPNTAQPLDRHMIAVGGYITF